MVLKKAGIYAEELLAKKRLLDMRKGRLYSIHVDEVYKLEKLLQVRFVGEGRKTRIESDESNDPTERFHCVQVRRSRLGKGCINIRAHNREVAIVKCALVARSKRWFGAVAEKGSCSNRTS
jgi:hypothetical protein